MSETSQVRTIHLRSLSPTGTGGERLHFPISPQRGGHASPVRERVGSVACKECGLVLLPLLFFQRSQESRCLCVISLFSNLGNNQFLSKKKKICKPDKTCTPDTAHGPPLLEPGRAGGGRELRFGAPAEPSPSPGFTGPRNPGLSASVPPSATSGWWDHRPHQTSELTRHGNRVQGLWGLGFPSAVLTPRGGGGGFSRLDASESPPGP